MWTREDKYKVLPWTPSTNKQTNPETIIRDSLWVEIGKADGKRVDNLVFSQTILPKQRQWRRKKYYTCITMYSAIRLCLMLWRASTSTVQPKINWKISMIREHELPYNSLKTPKAIQVPFICHKAQTPGGSHLPSLVLCPSAFLTYSFAFPAKGRLTGNDDVFKWFLRMFSFSALFSIFSWHLH